MARSDDLYKLPPNLPVPSDDGACKHLLGMKLPSIPLMTTLGRVVDLSGLSGTTVVYCYPRTGSPDRDPPKGWNEIPGARGCTPQSCNFRDRFKQFKDMHVRVFGLSTQASEYQQEAVRRLELPYELLSDHNLAFANALKLPTFEVESMTLIKRLSLVIKEGKIEAVFYPVFPPSESADVVIEWLARERVKV